VKPPAQAGLEHPSSGPPVSAEDWRRTFEAIGPASLLVAIEDRMSDALKGRVSPDDILQESFLHAWRDRDSIEWRGLRAFRSWVLTIIDHRIRDTADREAAVKRGGGATIRSVHSDAAGSGPPEPAVTTTPSRVASYREQAELMRDALRVVDEDCREVVRLRLFDRLPIDEIAARLLIGPSAVRHRFRRGVLAYEQELNALLRNSTPRNAALRRADSSST
jgi:RNA polymerase sigma factor (sigma-70 family)